MDAFVWLDLETTGLDPVKDNIIEIGCVITDLQFFPLHSFHMWVNEPHGLHYDDYVVVEMHRESGLFDEALTIDESAFYGRKGYQQMDIDFSEHLRFAQRLHGLETLYPAGSSVHFDISFLRAIQQDLTLDMLSHRHFDVTSLKLFTYAQTGEYPKFPEVEPKHRAMSDIESSINVAKAFFLPVKEADLRVEHTTKIVESRLED